jgi:hypothetical protein
MAVLLKAANTLASGATAYQDRKNHDSSLGEEKRLFDISLGEMKNQFKIEMQEARRTYLLSMYADMETYFQELNENLISSSRDAERDMVDQRNQQFQTILISATIMLACLLNIMFQGTLQTDLHWLFYAGFSLFNTLSLVSLVINVALCILITSRVTKFMYRKSDANIKHLRKVMRHTKDMMRNLRGTGATDTIQCSLNSAVGPSGQVNSSEDIENHDYKLPSGGSMLEAYPSLEDHENSLKHKKPRLFPQLSFTLRSKVSSSPVFPDQSSSPDRPAKVTMRKNIALLSDADVEKEWSEHEKQVNEYLNHRSRLGERLEAMAAEQENQERMSFELFWTKYCRTMANTALVLFYFGTSCLLIGTIIFAWTNFIIIYKSDISAISSVATIGISLIICCGLAVYLRYFDSSIAMLNAQLDSEQHQDAKKYWRRMWKALRFVNSGDENYQENKDN